MDYSKIKPVFSRFERSLLLDQVGRLIMHKAVENGFGFREDVVAAILQTVNMSMYSRLYTSISESVDFLLYPKYWYGTDESSEIEDADDPSIKKIVMVEISQSILPIMLFLPELILHLPPVLEGAGCSFWTTRNDDARIKALRETQKTLKRQSRTCDKNDRKKIIGIIQSVQKASDEYKLKLKALRCETK